MSADLTQAVLVESLRALFVLGLPVAIGVAIGGLLVGAFQGMTSIRDSASAYAMRLAALVLVLYVSMPLYVRTLTDLVLLVMR